MPSISLIAIRTLHEDGRIGKTLSEDFTSDVIKTNSFADVATRLLNHGIAIHVREQPKAKSEQNMLAKLLKGQRP